MKAPVTVQRFIELRALGWSFVRIAESTHLHEPLPLHTDFIPILDRFSTARRVVGRSVQPEAVTIQKRNR